MVQPGLRTARRESRTTTLSWSTLDTLIPELEDYKTYEDALNVTNIVRVDPKTHVEALTKAVSDVKTKKCNNS